MSRKAFRIALLAAAVSATPVVASAASYAVSLNEITNFSLGFSDSNAQLNSFTFTSDMAVENGSSAANAGTTDTNPACVGTACASYNNSFVSHTPLTTVFSYGDTLVGNTNVLAGLGTASAIGETYVTSSLGTGAGNNSMFGSVFFTVPTTVSLSFYADPFLNTILSAGGQASTASMSFSIAIRDDSGNAVFNWAPDGQVTGTSGITGSVGGTEYNDASNLNTSIGANVTYNPASGLFSATSNLIAPGAYQLTIDMKNSVFAQSAVVPVPAAAWLLGSGLIGLVAVARRKSH